MCFVLTVEFDTQAAVCLKQDYIVSKVGVDAI